MTPGWYEESWEIPWLDRPLRPYFFRASLHHALQAIARLEGMSSVLPDLEPIYDMLRRREAGASANVIEDDIPLSEPASEVPDTSLGELLLFELGALAGFPKDSPFDDMVRLAKLMGQRHRIGGLDAGAIQDLQRELLGEQRPVPWRTQGRWIPGHRPDMGHARYCFAAPADIERSMEEWCTFLRNRDLDYLTTAAVAYIRLSTIQPFDRNGEISRLLFQWLLSTKSSFPPLCVSKHLKGDRASRIEMLQGCKSKGRDKFIVSYWDRHVGMVLSAISSAALEATQLLLDLKALLGAHEAQIRGIGRASKSALLLHGLFKRQGVLTVTAAAQQLGVSFPTANNAMSRLAKLGIVHEWKRAPGHHRVFGYVSYLRTLDGFSKPAPSPS